MNPIPTTQIVTTSFSLVIDGSPPIWLTEDILSIRFEENLRKCIMLEVLLNNWGSMDGTVGFLYSEKSYLHVGASIRLFAGEAMLAKGTIAMLTGRFPSGSPASLLIAIQPKHPYRRAPRPIIPLKWGAELVDFQATLHKDGKTSLPKIEAAGSTTGTPYLMAGTRVKIEQVSPTWTGEYLVTSTTHTFDQQYGYRTSFTCSDGKRRLPARHKLTSA